MKTLASLKELIQDDIICCTTAFDPHLEDSELLNNLCQIVVDRINEYVEN